MAVLVDTIDRFFEGAAPDSFESDDLARTLLRAPKHAGATDVLPATVS